MTYDTPMPLGSDDFYNSLSEDWNEPYTQDLRVVSAEERPMAQEPFAEIDSYPVERAGLLRDCNQAPVLTVRQAG
jgi:hypothetical protein